MYALVFFASSRVIQLGYLDLRRSTRTLLYDEDTVDNGIMVMSVSTVASYWVVIHVVCPRLNRFSAS